MAFNLFIGATCACLVVVTFSADAALVGRLAATSGGTDYQAYYDDVAKLTWLADANYSQTTGYDDDGLMNWGQANSWAANLVIDSVANWRLAETLQPDSSCSWQTPNASYGYSCAGSELGNLFHNVLGNLSYYDSDMNTQEGWGLNNIGPFDNMQARYWSSEYATYTDNAWGFNVHTGYQVSTDKTNDTNLFAWAVHDGDIGVVPIPGAAWLFGSGLIGLIGVARRKKA